MATEKEFHHVTKTERKKAIALWNKFNKDLGKLGLTLHYDYGHGHFIVADKALEPACFKYHRDDPIPEDEFTLTREELERVIDEGEFDRTAVNNPPWFVNPHSYSLKVPERKSRR